MLGFLSFFHFAQPSLHELLCRGRPFLGFSRYFHYSILFALFCYFSYSAFHFFWYPIPRFRFDVQIFVIHSTPLCLLAYSIFYLSVLFSLGTFMSYLYLMTSAESLTIQIEQLAFSVARTRYRSDRSRPPTLEAISGVPSLLQLKYVSGTAFTARCGTRADRAGSGEIFPNYRLRGIDVFSHPARFRPVRFLAALPASCASSPRRAYAGSWNRKF